MRRTEHIYSNLIGTLAHQHLPHEFPSETPSPQPQPVPEPVTSPMSVQAPAPPPPPPVVAPSISQTPKPGVAEQNCAVQTSNSAGLSYISAIITAVNGGRVRRTSWAEGIYLYVEDGIRIMKCTEGDHLPNKAVVDKFTPLVSDVLSCDWVLLVRQNCSFQEALEAMEQGQSVRRASWTAPIQIQEGKFCLQNDIRQEYTMRYEDIHSTDWETAYHPAR